MWLCHINQGGGNMSEQTDPLSDEACRQFMAIRTVYAEGEHEPGCPAISDDESDYEYLYDAGECVCAKGKAREAFQQGWAECRRRAHQDKKHLALENKLLRAFVSDLQGEERCFLDFCLEIVAKETEPGTSKETVLAILAQKARKFLEEAK
jgi:hypothetical protein